MSGFFDGKKILLFNWANLTYNLQTSKLSGDRTYGTCAMLKGIKGEKLVAIASGNSPGIEVWNPADGLVKTLNPTFPLGGSGPQMIAVNGDTELILYESSQSFKNIGSPLGVWKFSQVLQNLQDYL